MGRYWLSLSGCPKLSPGVGLVLGVNAVLTKPGRVRFPYREPNTDVLSQPDGFTAPYETGTNNTSVYRDTVTSQRVMVGTYVFLPLWMALLVPMVSRKSVGDSWVECYMVSSQPGKWLPPDVLTQNFL